MIDAGYDGFNMLIAQLIYLFSQKTEKHVGIVVSELVTNQNKTGPFPRMSNDNEF